MKIFDFFTKKVVKEEASNVVDFPKEYKEYIEPKEKPAIVFYRIGATDRNRISFQMGYSEITMNKDGVNNLIRQLETFRDQLTDEDQE